MHNTDTRKGVEGETERQKWFIILSDSASITISYTSIITSQIFTIYHSITCDELI